MKEFFENLKKIRKERGITLEQMAQRSKIPLNYLQDIENNNFENLPQGYDRIFFKRYLKEIGEDNEDVWRDFNLFFGSGPLEKKESPITDVPALEEEESEIPEESKNASEDESKSSFFQDISLRFNMDRLHLYFWIAVTMIVLGVVGYFAYQQFVFVKDNQFQVKEITVPEFIEEMQKQDSLLTPTMSQNAVSGSTQIAESTGVNVKLLAQHRTWIREIRDQKDTTDYIMPPGLSRNILADNSVQLMLGRADGVEIWLNDQEVGVVGDSNQIALRLLLTPAGLTDKRLKTITKSENEGTD
jgi:cytoskeletal protein RodZ